MFRISKNRCVFLYVRACIFNKIICFLSFFAVYNITFQYDTPCTLKTLKFQIAKNFAVDSENFEILPSHVIF